MWSHQALRGSEYRALAVALNGTTLQHEVQVVFHLRRQYVVSLQSASYLVVLVGSKLLAPTIKLKVQHLQLSILPIAKRYRRMVASPSVVAWAQCYLCILLRLFR